jgi:hypothetical protein
MSVKKIRHLTETEYILIKKSLMAKYIIFMLKRFFNDNNVGMCYITEFTKKYSFQKIKLALYLQNK